MVHEAKVAHFVQYHKLAKIEILGKTYRFDQNSFKFRIDLVESNKDCQVCYKGVHCTLKCKSLRSYEDDLIYGRLLDARLPADFD